MSETTFQVTHREYIPAIRSEVTVSEHPSKGTVLVHLLCREERENFFSVCFRTPPEDDTGVPHIIEHNVLGGSEKYPVRDPFMEMVKSSMATFINALTYGDRTFYPCGSLNRKDFMNLVSVYMDAVFHPLLKEDFFAREGYRLALDEDSGKLVHSGVVYNEMSGAYSDRDSYMERETVRSLYPEGSCGRDSGGDPPAIATLTYEKFIEFYEKHYTTSNCCVFALTRIPNDEFSSYIDSMLPENAPGKPALPFKMQNDFLQPVRLDLPVPGDDSDCTVLSAWKVNSAGDPVETLAFSLLEDVLLEDDSSPVKAKLLDSELGTGLASSGYDSDPFQRNFVIGLKGVERKNTGVALALIHQTLEDLFRNGINRKLVESMLHRKELNLKYMGSGWPYALMSSVAAAWTHCEDIILSLDLNRLMDDLRSRMRDDPRLLEEMIGKWLVSNNHRADIVFYPDEQHFQKEEENAGKLLDRIRGSLSESGLNKIKNQSQRMNADMDTGNTPEEIASLPKLSLSDIPGESPAIFHETLDIGQRTILATEIHTAGLCYLDLTLDMTGLPPELIPHLTFYAGLITRTGADGMDHLKMAEEELACSGGINASATSVTSTVDSTDEYRIVLRISGHCLERDLERMLDVIRKRLLYPELENSRRILSVAGEMSEHIRSSIVPGGHTFASLTAKSGISMGHLAADLLEGIPYLRNVTSIGRKTAGKESAALGRILDHITGGIPGSLAWTGPGSGLNTAAEWLKTLPLLPGTRESSGKTVNHDTAMVTGIKIKAATCFAAAAMPGLPVSDPRTASGIVMMRMLSEGFLWDEIRSRRGAYGAGAGLGGGTVSLYSYRDPSPVETVALFREAITNGFPKLDLEPRSIEDSIIASVKGIDPPVRPAMANGMAIMRHLRGIGRDFAGKHRSRLLAVNRHSIADYADWMGSSPELLRVCILGNEKCSGSLEVTHSIIL